MRLRDVPPQSYNGSDESSHVGSGILRIKYRKEGPAAHVTDLLAMYRP